MYFTPLRQWYYSHVRNWRQSLRRRRALRQRNRIGIKLPKIITIASNWQRSCLPGPVHEKSIPLEIYREILQFNESRARGVRRLGCNCEPDFYDFLRTSCLKIEKSEMKFKQKNRLSLNYFKLSLIFWSYLYSKVYFSNREPTAQMYLIFSSFFNFHRERARVPLFYR